jgi:hypothetical protein
LASLTLLDLLDAPFGEQKAKMLHFPGMNEGRKRTLLIAACILAARQLVQWDGKQMFASC